MKLYLIKKMNLFYVGVCKRTSNYFLEYASETLIIHGLFSSVRGLF